MSTILESPALDPATYRPDFPILSRSVREGVPLVYLDNSASTQRPRQSSRPSSIATKNTTPTSIAAFTSLAQESDELFDEARAKVQRFINAPAPEQCIFTYGSTSGINTVARTLGRRERPRRRRNLLTEMEHHSNCPVAAACRADGRGVAAHPPDDDAGLLRARSARQPVTERTKLVAVTAVSNVLGTITSPTEPDIRRPIEAGAPGA